MSASLAAKPGARERFKVRSRCGCSWCARQMRCTVATGATGAAQWAAAVRAGETAPPGRPGKVGLSPTASDDQRRVARADHKAPAENPAGRSLSPGTPLYRRRDPYISGWAQYAGGGSSTLEMLDRYRQVREFLSTCCCLFLSLKRSSQHQAQPAFASAIAKTVCRTRLLGLR